MATPFRGSSGRLALLLALVPWAGGCHQLTTRGQHADLPAEAHSDGPIEPIPGGAPSEMDKVSLPPYVIEPPDLLLLQTVKLVPKHPYRIGTLDILQILVVGTLPEQPIAGPFAVDTNGTVDLGPSYGKVSVVGLSIGEANAAVKKYLSGILVEPQVSVTLAQLAGQQEVAGDHLVGLDGTVNLGTYGQVHVAGMTLEQAKAAVERQLSGRLEKPEVAVDVFSYNSKAYYIIQEGAGFGDQIVRVPITGNETVLDALAQVQGRTRLQSKRIWIARPAPGGVGCDQILPVKWDEITKGAATRTNYQILPGDRIFLAQDKLIALDSFLGKLVAPFERLFGVSLLGAQSIQTINRFPTGQNTGLGGG